MESDVTQTAIFYKLWAWGDANRKQLLWGLLALVVVALGIVFWFVHQNNVQIDANNALSRISTPTGPSRVAPVPESFLTVATDYPGTDAGQRARLLGASELFATGRFEEAQAQFQRFIQEYGDSPFAGEAALGVAVCTESLGRTNDAIMAYRNVVEHYQTITAVPQARFALAHLLEQQGDFRDAQSELKELIRAYPNMVGPEANRELDILQAVHPELVSTNTPTPAMPPPTLTKP